LPTPATDQTVEQAGERRSTRIESLRAVAALAVLLGHVWGQSHDYNPAQTLATLGDRALTGGGFGVFLFFALSGYLLYWPFARRDLDEGRQIDYGTYALNRALRILPLYFVVVVVVLAVKGAGPERWATWLLFAETFTTNRAELLEGNGLMWSLVIEIHFYALLPFLAYGIARVAGGSVWKTVAVLLALGAVSFVYRYFSFYDEARAERPWPDYQLFSTFFFFVAGMVLAPLRIAWQRDPPRLPRAEWWLLASAVLWFLVVENYTRAYLAAPASALLLGACVLPVEGGRVLRVLEWRVLAAVGIVSYSLYLWHLPLLELIDDASFAPSSFAGYLALAAPPAIAIAFLSFRVIESPFLRLRRRWGSTAAT
jgi:peptidoglycan/LPS O-acetylase OafA/YrhL